LNDKASEAREKLNDFMDKSKRTNFYSKYIRTHLAADFADDIMKVIEERTKELTNQLEGFESQYFTDEDKIKELEAKVEKLSKSKSKLLEDLRYILYGMNPPEVIKDFIQGNPIIKKELEAVKELTQTKEAKGSQWKN